MNNLILRNFKINTVVKSKMMMMMTWVGKISRTERRVVNTNFCEKIWGVEPTSEKQLYINFYVEMGFKDFVFLKRDGSKYISGRAVAKKVIKFRVL